jgi:hypothetical protein
MGLEGWSQAGTTGEQVFLASLSLNIISDPVFLLKNLFFQI